MGVAKEQAYLYFSLFPNSFDKICNLKFMQFLYANLPIGTIAIFT